MLSRTQAVSIKKKVNTEPGYVFGFILIYLSNAQLIPASSAQYSIESGEEGLECANTQGFQENTPADITAETFGIVDRTKIGARCTVSPIIGSIHWSAQSRSDLAHQMLLEPSRTKHLQTWNVNSSQNVPELWVLSKVMSAVSQQSKENQSHLHIGQIILISVFEAFHHTCPVSFAIEPHAEPSIDQCEASSDYRCYDHNEKALRVSRRIARFET
jgi:hypothetical protein